MRKEDKVLLPAKLKLKLPQGFVWLAVPMLVVDAIYGLVILLVSWAKHR